jgi:hypothetical protein
VSASGMCGCRCRKSTHRLAFHASPARRMGENGVAVAGVQGAAAAWPAAPLLRPRAPAAPSRPGSHSTMCSVQTAAQAAAWPARAWINVLGHKARGSQSHSRAGHA